VEYRPNAHTFDENHKEIPKPYAGARVDGRYVTAPNLEGLVSVVRERLNVEKQQVTMQFEIRGYKDNYSINKKGDPLKRKLKTFTGESAIKEARAYMEQNKANLIKAWEGVKEAENVKETDVRSAENRQRVGKNYRQGRDATPEMFLDAFGFRGVEFGNWVSQGVNTKERQGMLNAAYDALMDLASIMGCRRVGYPLMALWALAWDPGDQGKRRRIMSRGQLLLISLKPGARAPWPMSGFTR
jgi:hypothetical protein